MSSIMISVLVTGAYFLITGALGGYLGRKGRPYNLVIKIIHGILSLFIIAGISFIITGIIQGVTNSKIFSSISLYLFGIASCVVFISGLIMAIIKNDKPILVSLHKIGSFIMVISIIASIIFLAVKI